MRSKILFGAMLLSVALSSRAFCGDCCVPASPAKPACCEKACGCQAGCGCDSGCAKGHFAEWLEAVFTIKCKTCILCQNPPAPERQPSPMRRNPTPRRPTLPRCRPLRLRSRPAKSDRTRDCLPTWCSRRNNLCKFGR